MADSPRRGFGSADEAVKPSALDGPQAGMAQRRMSRARGWLVIVGGVLLTQPAAAQSLTEAATDASWLSVLPPLIAIALALWLKDVTVALFCAVASGALILTEGNPFSALGRTIDTFVVPALADGDHASILIFSALLGAMVGVISRSGGTLGIVERLAPYATSSRRGQVVTWMMGVLIFFDDYANTLIVGSTMRPITDRLRISREKLAYIVDSTAAPVVSLIPISTWIGVEIGLVQDAFGKIGRDQPAFTAILHSIPYRFYQVFALVLGISIALSRRDFGPMLRAERRARQDGEVLGRDQTPLADFSETALAPPAGAPRRALNAGLPILVVIAVTVLALYLTGAAARQTAESNSLLISARQILEKADSYRALLWASLSGLLVAAGLAVGQGILDVRQTSRAALDGAKAMLGAFVVLILAWSLGGVCGELQTADFLVSVTSDFLAPQLIPGLTFILSAAVAFATGTSWGTMAILTPQVIPLAHTLLIQGGFSESGGTYEAVLFGTIASVLSGSVWGDHCSPISDTTILSSMASGCDHIAHVRTQVPYALSAGIAAVLVGSLPTALGVTPWLSLLSGSALVLATLLWLGKRAESAV